MPLRIELIADNPEELQRMLRSLAPLIQGHELAPASDAVAILNADGKVAAFATTTEVKATRKGKAKTDAPAEPTPAGSEDAAPEEGLDAPADVASAPAPDTGDKDDKTLLKEAIDSARVLFARGVKGSTRIAELRAKYNPDPSKKNFKFDEVPAERIAEFHADVMGSLEEIPA